MYTVEHLTLPEVRDVYARCMTRDFPRNELKPLSAIEHALRRGEYLCFGLKESGQVLAYAFFVCPGCQGKKQYLFDYLAVLDHLRGNGIGSRLLEALTSGPLKDAGCILLEVDDPSKATDPAETIIRNRRMHFYLRNGLRDTGVRSLVYGVHYRILEIPVHGPHTPSEARAIYEHFYRTMFPPVIYAQKFRACVDAAHDP